MNARGPITTHILDVNRGKPAAGVAVNLELQHGNDWKPVAHGKTDDDGRVEGLLPPGPLPHGIYRLTFATGEYFRSLSLETFYPYAVVVFEVKNPSEHYHVPLLLSGHGYSTYRGS